MAGRGETDSDGGPGGMTCPKAVRPTVVTVAGADGWRFPGGIGGLTLAFSGTVPGRECTPGRDGVPDALRVRVWSGTGAFWEELSLLCGCGKGLPVRFAVGLDGWRFPDGVARLTCSGLTAKALRGEMGWLTRFGCRGWSGRGRKRVRDRAAGVFPGWDRSGRNAGTGAMQQVLPAVAGALTLPSGAGGRQVLCAG